MNAALPAPAFVAPENPRLKTFSTIVIFAGSLLTALTLPTNVTELEIYRYCAFTMLGTIVLAFGIEGLAGVRALIRVDIVILATLYFLTFAEFLHPHVRILYETATGEAPFACNIVLIGFCGIAFGRHLNFRGSSRSVDADERTSLPEISPKAIMRVFFLFVFLGYFYVLLTTQFNIFDVIAQLLKPRFQRPWQRGQEGNWLSFLTELQLLNYLAAALGGYIFANSKRFSLLARSAVVVILLFMLFFDCAEGARNVVLIKTGLLMVTFFISNREVKSLRIVIVSLLGIAALWTVSGYMLDFRNVGIGAYVADAANGDDEQDDGFMIDNNMVSIARIAQVFPSTYPFPGTEVVAQVVTKWIPRALWPGKPTVWTVSIEDALNTGGKYTLAVTYVGEAYLIAGVPTVILISILLGAAAASWTRVGLAARTNLDLIYYASGFFAAALAMRSIQFVTIAMVPTVAFYVFGRYFVRRKSMKKYAF